MRPALVMAPPPPARGLLAAKVSLVAGISQLFNQRALRRELEGARRFGGGGHSPPQPFEPYAAYVASAQGSAARGERHRPRQRPLRRDTGRAGASPSPPSPSAGSAAVPPRSVPRLPAHARRSGLHRRPAADERPCRRGARPLRLPAWRGAKRQRLAAAVLPDGFSGLPALAMRVRVEPGELLLFVRLDAAHRTSFDEDAELMLQSVTVKGRPVVLLGLEGAGRVVARLALDGLAAEARELLNRLQRDFKAQLVLCDGDRARSPRSIFAPREGNAAAIAARLERHREAPQVSADEACECVLRDPPKTHDARWPFAPARVQSQSPASVLASVAQLEAWLQPDRVEQVLVEHAVPKHVIEAWQRRVLLSARSFGIALPDVLLEFVVEHRLADSRASWVRAQLAAFKQREERKQNDLDSAGTAHNWDAALGSGRGARPRGRPSPAPAAAAGRSRTHGRGAGMKTEIEEYNIQLGARGFMGSGCAASAQGHPAGPATSGTRAARPSDRSPHSASQGASESRFPPGWRVAGFTHRLERPIGSRFGLFMRLAIFSDVHANLEALSAVLKRTATSASIGTTAWATPSATAAPRTSVRTSFATWREITILGNHDAAVAGRMDYSYYYEAARHALDTHAACSDRREHGVAQELAVQAHARRRQACSSATARRCGSRSSSTSSRPSRRASACRSATSSGTSRSSATRTCARCSRSRRATVEELPPTDFELKDGYKYIVSVGSVGQPRDYDNRASYTVYDTDEARSSSSASSTTSSSRPTKIFDGNLERNFAHRLFIGV